MSSDRLSGLEDDWLHPNYIGLYAGLLVLTVVLGKFPKWIQVPAFILGSYVLMLTQSRGAIAATGITLVLYILMNWRKVRFKWIPLLIIPCLMFIFGSEDADTIIGNVPVIGPVTNIIRRSERSDPTAGRLGFLAVGFDKLEESPLIGFGFRGGDFNSSDRVTYIENTLMNTMLESGIIGGTLYLIIGVSTCFIYWGRTRVFAKDKRLALSGFDPIVAESGALMISFLLIHGLVERDTILQNGSAHANTVAVLMGCLCYEPARRYVQQRALPGQTSSTFTSDA